MQRAQALEDLGHARPFLVGDRRAKQCHEAIPEELVDGALVPMDFGERQLKESVKESVHRLGTETLG